MAEENYSKRIIRNLMINFALKKSCTNCAGFMYEVKKLKSLSQKIEKELIGN